MQFRGVTQSEGEGECLQSWQLREEGERGKKEQRGAEERRGEEMCERKGNMASFFDYIHQISS